MKRWAIMTVFLVGCAGMSRSCSSCNAGAFGSDWLVVQYRTDGSPINCWKLHDTSVTNESESDGIYWQEKPSGHLVHISGWYNRVQIEKGDWAGAGKSIGIDLNRCTNGAYGVAEVW